MIEEIINETYKDGDIPLIITCKNDTTELVKYLLLNPKETYIIKKKYIYILFKYIINRMLSLKKKKHYMD